MFNEQPVPSKDKNTCMLLVSAFHAFWALAYSGNRTASLVEALKNDRGFHKSQASIGTFI